ncbi:MAG: TrgA family protein [Pseudomonadota bacterium]
MPTAPKLVGAILFFGVAWVAALSVLDTLPEETPARYFPLSIAVIGFWQGWVVAGGHAGEGMRAAIGTGIRVSVQIAFFGLLLHALRTMFIRSSRLLYDGPGEAAIAAMELFLEYLLQSMTVPIWGTLIGGGIIAGLLVEWSSRRWR